MKIFHPEIQALRRRVRPLIIDLSHIQPGSYVSLPRVSERERRAEVRAWRARVRAGVV